MRLFKLTHRAEEQFYLAAMQTSFKGSSTPRLFVAIVVLRSIQSAFGQTDAEICTAGDASTASGLPDNVDTSTCVLDPAAPCALEACASGFFELTEGTGEIACTVDAGAAVLEYTDGDPALACVGNPWAARPPLPPHC